MNFYIAEPVTRLPLFNFLVRYIFTEVLFKYEKGVIDDFVIGYVAAAVWKGG